MKDRLVLILFALFIAEMTVTFESTMVYAALPTLIRQFGDPITAGWLVTIHLLVTAACCPIAGRLGDIYGCRKVVLVLLALGAIGSVLSAVSSGFGGVLAGRALQGLSSAVVPLSIGIVRKTLPAQRVPMGIGMLTTAQGAGAALGLVLGGAIIDRFEWHTLFWASAGLLVLSYLLVLRLVPAKPGAKPSQPINWIEGLLPAPAVAMLLLGLSLTKTMRWLDGRVLMLLGGGLLILALWSRMSLRSSEPFINLRLFADRNFALANGISVLLAMGTMQIVYVFSAYIQSPAWTAVGLGLTATAAGVAKLPSNVTSFFAGPLGGWMTQRSGLRVPIMLGTGLALIGWLIALSLPQQLIWLILLLIVISFGTTMLQAGIPTLVVAAVPDERTGEAMGTLSVVRSMATAVGAQVIALFMASATVAAPGGGAAFPSAAAFQMTMGWIAGLTLGVLLLAFLIRETAALFSLKPRTDRVHPHPQ